VATGTTNDFNYSRDQIINEALRKLGVLALEDNADAAGPVSDPYSDGGLGTLSDAAGPKH